jgi:hypothetical protein
MTCRVLVRHFARAAVSFALDNTGNSIAISTVMRLTTTSSSMSVNP